MTLYVSWNYYEMIGIALKKRTKDQGFGDHAFAQKMTLYGYWFHSFLAMPLSSVLLIVCAREPGFAHYVFVIREERRKRFAFTHIKGYSWHCLNFPHDAFDLYLVRRLYPSTGPLFIIGTWSRRNEINNHDFLISAGSTNILSLVGWIL